MLLDRLFEYVDRYPRRVLVIAALAGGVSLVDAVWSIADRIEGGVDLAAILGVVRLASGPVALVLALLLFTRMRQHNKGSEIERLRGDINALMRAFAEGQTAQRVTPEEPSTNIHSASDDPHTLRKLALMSKIVSVHFGADFDYVLGENEFSGLGIPPELVRRTAQDLIDDGWVRYSDPNWVAHVEGGLRPTLAGIRELARQMGSDSASPG